MCIRDSGKTDKALSVLDRLMGKERAAPELVEIKESFRKQESSMRPYFLFMGMWLVLFLLLYGALELAGNTSCLLYTSNSRSSIWTAPV